MTGPARPQRRSRVLTGFYAFVARIILPRRFYEECATNLVETFSDALRERGARSGYLGKVVVCADEFFGLVVAALREQARAAGRLRTSKANRPAPNRRFDVTWLPRELRYSLRSLARSPGVACAAILALALGIAATTTMFSVSHGLLRDMPFEEPDRLVYLGLEPVSETGIEDYRVSAHEILDWREQQSTLEGIAGYAISYLNLSDLDQDPERVSGARVTANSFDALRVRPVIGRGFRSEEERPGAEPVVVLGHALWKNRYNLDPGVLGRVVRVDGIQRTVVGVMPEGFKFPEVQNIWIPLELDRTAVERGDRRGIHAFGRLADEVSLEDLRAEYATLRNRLDLSYPGVYDGWRTRAIPFKQHFVDSYAVLIMNMMVLVVSFVLIIACANVANLLLARAASRSREIAVRTALGASRTQVVGQMLVESLVLSVFGGFIGIALAYLGVAAFSAWVTPFVPYHWMNIRIDAMVLWFTTGLVFLASVVAGTAPALKVTCVNVNTVLKDQALGIAGLRLGRLSRVLVVGQVSLSCGLLTVSGLMVKGARQNMETELTCATTDVLTAQVSLQTADYPENADRDRFYRELVSRLEGLPGVSAAAVVSHLPGVTRSVWHVQLEGVEYGEDRGSPRTHRAVVSPGFFDALDVGLVEGREFTAGDNAGAQPVVIVNQRFAERFFPEEPPLGKRIRTASSTSVGDWMTIVGVAPNLAMNQRISANEDGIYVPFSQQSQSSMSVLLRAQDDPTALVPSLREVVASLDPHLPIYGVNSLAERISMQTVPERAFSVLFVCCGAAALVLAVVGLYGVMAFAVRRRTKEIGIRMALGAKAERILWLSFRGGLAQLVIGLLAGVGLAALVAPPLAGMYAETGAWDWKIYIPVALTLCCAGIGASVLPALRAARVDPMQTLRCE